MTLNKMMIIGNLGADPELRYTPGGKAVTDLRVAVNDNRQGARRRVDRGDALVPRERLGAAGRATRRAAAQGQQDLRRRPAASPRVRGARRPEADVARARASPASSTSSAGRATRMGDPVAVAPPLTTRRRRCARAAPASPSRSPNVPPRRARRWTSTTFPSSTHQIHEDRYAPWPAHDPAASRRTTTETADAARSATSASTRRRASTTRRSTASAAT